MLTPSSPLSHWTVFICSATVSLHTAALRWQKWKATGRLALTSKSVSWSLSDQGNLSAIPMGDGKIYEPPPSDPKRASIPRRCPLGLHREPEASRPIRVVAGHWEQLSLNRQHCHNLSDMDALWWGPFLSVWCSTKPQVFKESDLSGTLRIYIIVSWGHAVFPLGTCE